VHCGWSRVAGATLQLAREHSPALWPEILRPQAGLPYISFSTSISASSALWCILIFFLSISNGNSLEGTSNCHSAISAQYYHHGSHGLAREFGSTWFIPRKWHTFQETQAGDVGRRSAHLFDGLHLSKIAKVGLIVSVVGLLTIWAQCSR